MKDFSQGLAYSIRGYMENWTKIPGFCSRQEAWRSSASFTEFLKLLINPSRPPFYLFWYQAMHMPKYVCTDSRLQHYRSCESEPSCFDRWGFWHLGRHEKQFGICSSPMLADVSAAVISSQILTMLTFNLHQKIPSEYPTEIWYSDLLELLF